MSARRVSHANQRTSHGLRPYDSVFDRITVVSTEPLIPVPEVYVLDLSEAVFDALYGPQIGPLWAETSAEFPELLDARDTPVNTRF